MRKTDLIKKIRKLAAKAAVFGAAMAIATSIYGMDRQVYAKDEAGNIVIVIDPGHGGNDPGKIGVNGVSEEDANYAIASAMKEELGKYSNVRVYYTRPEDSWFTNTGRAMMASALDADFLISIHNNSGTETSAGAIVYTSVLPLYSSITADMGNNILSNLSALGIADNGIQIRESTEYVGEDYYTIMGEAMRAGVPTVLVEHCFLSNPVDSLHVSNEDGSVNYEKTTQIGQADAQAVVSYFNLELNTALADSQTTVQLEKGYSFEAQPSASGIGEISWLSSNSNVAVVDEEGLVTALNSGSANIMYSYTDGTNGYVTVEVAVPAQVALVGALDPTFYSTQEEFNGIKLGDVIAQVAYSDGSVRTVAVDTVGSVDLAKVGIQDIPISYGTLDGSVRVCFADATYVPEVTSKETEAETQLQTEAATMPSVTETQPTETERESEGSSVFSYLNIIRLVAAVVIVTVLGTVIYLIENHISKKRKRRNKRRRRY